MRYTYIIPLLRSAHLLEFMEVPVPHLKMEERPRKRELWLGSLLEP